MEYISYIYRYSLQFEAIQAFEIFSLCLFPNKCPQYLFHFEYCLLLILLPKDAYYADVPNHSTLRY